MIESEKLFDEIYNRTKDFGMVHFVREIQRLMIENKQLKEELELEKQINVEDLKTIDRQQEIIQELKDNWSKLKEYFKYEIEFDKRWYIPESEEYIAQKHFPDDTIDGFIYALNKMQELEKGDSNE